MYLDQQAIFAAEVEKPEFLKEWREYQFSLTEKLQIAKGNVQLELLSQAWSKTTWWDQSLLHVQDKYCFLREIFMKHDGQAYWYARTVIPKKCYDLKPDFFDRLQHESIKNLIFGERSVRRINLICYPVNQNCLEFHWVKKYLHSLQDVLWVRLAEFSFQQTESFYLAEVLLPELESIV